MRKSIFLVLLFTGYSFFVFSIVTEKDSTKTRKLGVLPVPAFGYAPETKWYVGAVCLFTFHLKHDSVTRISSAKAEFNYTQNKQIIISAGWSVWSKHNNYFFKGDNSFQKFPEYFWGIGNSTPESNKELYNANRIELDNLFYKKFAPNFYAGAGYRFQNISNVSYSTNSLLSKLKSTGGNGGLSSGIVLSTFFDSRKNPLNPEYKSKYLAASFSFFDKLLGSNYTFNRIETDARFYFYTGKKQLIAIQNHNIFSSGQVPFRMMALLGSDSDMRGFYRGRFRDKNYISLQAEYRLTIYRRWGIAAFVGVGDVFLATSDLGLSKLKYAAGTGLRFKIDRKENINLRLDYAVGKNTSGFYVVFGEAF